MTDNTQCKRGIIFSITKHHVQQEKRKTTKQQPNKLIDNKINLPKKKNKKKTNKTNTTKETAISAWPAVNRSAFASFALKLNLTRIVLLIFEIKFDLQFKNNNFNA